MTGLLWTLTAIAWLGSALIVAHEYAVAPTVDDDGED